MPGLIALSARSDWSYGGSILTFVFPMILLLAVLAALYVLYTKPQTVPGGRSGPTRERSVAATLDAGAPGGTFRAPGPAAGQTATAGAEQATDAGAGHTTQAGTGQAGPADGAEGKE